MMTPYNTFQFIFSFIPVLYCMVFKNRNSMTAKKVNTLKSWIYSIKSIANPPARTNEKITSRSKWEARNLQEKNNINEWLQRK